MENLPVEQKKKGPGSIALRDGVLSPSNFDEMWHISVLFAKSGMMPDAYNNNPEGIMVAGQFGAQLGLSLMASIQNIAVVKGHPTVYGDSQKALVQDSKTLDTFIEYFEGTRRQTTSRRCASPNARVSVVNIIPRTISTPCGKKVFS
jgi:hypothetical protein